VHLYAVLLEAAAERNLRRLDAAMFRRVVVTLRALAADPRAAGCRELAGSERDWRVRVGDYRVVYEKGDDGHEVRVMRIRHRRDVYR